MDKFVKTVAIVTITMLAIIFVNTYIGVHYMGHEYSGVDDVVETTAIEGHTKNPHPLLELPGDAEVGAFTVAALGTGIIIGFLWRKLFYEESEEKPGVKTTA